MLEIKGSTSLKYSKLVAYMDLVQLQGEVSRLQHLLSCTVHIPVVADLLCVTVFMSTYVSDLL